MGIKVSEVLPISVRTPFFYKADYKPKGITRSSDSVAEQIVKCLERSQAERTTHRPTALGFSLDALLRLGRLA